MGIKRLYARAIMAGILTGGICLSGCFGPAPELPQGAAEHEVLTLTPVAQDKMLITLRGVDGVQVAEMEKAIEEKFPDVDIVVTNNTWIQEDVDNDRFQDIVLVSNSSQVNWDASKKFIDMSGESFTQNYYLSSMWESETADGLFFLPGPSNVYGIIYNKDMFARYGWEVPGTLDGFIDLCRAIEAQGIRAIQPALFYSDAGRQFFTGFSYEPVFAGLRNNLWYKDYKTGKARMDGHMEPAFEIMQRFVDAGILRPEDFEVKPATRTHMMYVEQSCAMILETQDAVKYCTEYGGENAPEIGMMPFFSGNGPNSDYLLSVPNYFIAANKALEQPGNEKKLAKVLEIFAYMSTIEGQKAVTSNDSTRISSVRGAEWSYNSFLEGVKDTIEKGNVVKQPFFVGDSNTDVDRELKNCLQMFAQGGMTAEEVMRDLDAVRDRVLKQEEAWRNAAVLGTAEEDFTALQTAQLFADIFKEKADAQIGLCMANTRAGGCIYRLYEGELSYGGKTYDSLGHNIEEGFQKNRNHKDKNKLTKITMTGKALLETLNEIYNPDPTYPDAYWVASGLKITFAPWAGEGKRVARVTLSDGSAITPSQIYTVAVWNGIVNPECITEVKAYYDESATELFRERVKAKGSIKPELDEDFVLIWDHEG